MRIETASLKAPPGLRELLADLGGGENGFVGTPVHSGEATLEEYLKHCCEMLDESKLPHELVPQTMFWMLNLDGLAVDIVRMRHYLDDKLRNHGGHIGFLVRHDQRGKGYAKEALQLALIELRKMGEGRTLLTVDPDNVPSIKVIERNGGRFQDISTDPETGCKFRRYWIEMEPQLHDKGDGVYPLPKSCKLYYHFDFGDDWYFGIRKIRKKPHEPAAGVTYRRVVEAIGPNPPQYGDY